MQQTQSSKILYTQELEATCHSIVSHGSGVRGVLIETLEHLLRAEAPPYSTILPSKRQSSTLFWSYTHLGPQDLQSLSQ